MPIFAKYTDYDDFDYELPISSDNFERTLELLRDVPLGNIRRLVSINWLKRSDYHDEAHRRKYLASHFIANEKGLAAPAFRQMVTQRSHQSLTEEQELISRDRQLIDIHYLYCHHRNDLKLKKNDETVSFLDRNSKEFDDYRARAFVCIGARKFIKTGNMLGIPESVQLRLSYYQSDAVRKRVTRANEKAQELSSNLRDYARTSKSRLKPDKLERLSDDLLPLILGRGDVPMALELKCAMNGWDYYGEERREYSKHMSESKRWFEKGLIGTF